MNNAIGTIFGFAGNILGSFGQFFNSIGLGTFWNRLIGNLFGYQEKEKLILCSKINSSNNNKPESNNPSFLSELSQRKSSLKSQPWFFVRRSMKVDPRGSINLLGHDLVPLELRVLSQKVRVERENLFCYGLSFGLGLFKLQVDFNESGLSL